MALVLTAPPIVEPVSLAEIKDFLRIDASDTSNDAVISALALSARTWCEVYCQRRFVQQTWKLLMDFFPGYIDLKLAGQKVSSPFVSGSNAVLVGIRYAIVLPYPPVQSISLFRYQNANGQVTQMTAGTDYIQDLDSQPARLTPPFGAMWPVASVVVNAVEIDYVCGYANPVTVSMSAQQGALNGPTFAATDIGKPVSIPGAGANGGTLNTIIASVTGGLATTRDVAISAVTNAIALVNMPESIKTAIKLLTNSWYENRIPDESNIPQAVKAVLSPYRDLRF